MSGEETARWYVVNHQNQPVELHLGGEVRVLGPRSEVEVREIDLGAPQLRVLQRARIVTARRVEAAASSTAASKSAPEGPPKAKPKLPRGKEA